MTGHRAKLSESMRGKARCCSRCGVAGHYARTCTAQLLAGAGDGDAGAGAGAAPRGRAPRRVVHTPEVLDAATGARLL